ncbi:hypothetical protein DERP_003145 [Dermatophagoides pteronyssinus]|uniref:Uncharacterized protein n=1 Tax=Dermatophagoides pteronyssinus TaxID=6956 RepID=A0ABQ8JIQ1_DERPT|nr:hypothetical protein DERP_003145 [Dermatophagoides pteronyssinus]
MQKQKWEKKLFKNKNVNHLSQVGMVVDKYLSLPLHVMVLKGLDVQLGNDILHQFLDTELDSIQSNTLYDDLIINLKTYPKRKKKNQD